MCQCPFLSTVEEKITCFKECAFFQYEGCSNGEGCPFKKIKSGKPINIKDIIGIDFNYDDEEDKEFIDRIYVKNYY
ncbi:MAG: hypothetical protein Q8930_05775 [Bacillota bacterium]|nr:hypothetical protein [Bacillota bacterium]